MVYSFTQISQYLRCPRSYRYRYLDGWREKETRVAMAFGRSFENALGAFFRAEDPGAALFADWGAYRDAGFEYKKGETWDRLVHQGIHLLQRFAQDDRIRVHDPQKDLQIKIVRNLPEGNEFLGYVDAIGELDGTRCIIDWKTTSARYPDAPEGLLSLDPQLICYSWLTGISEVAFVVFVRKHHAKELPKEGFKTEVERYLTGKETEPWEIIYFKLYKSQLPVVEQALETTALMLGSDKSRGYCLEIICADFIAGASTEQNQSEVLVLSLERLYRMLSDDRREQLLNRLKEGPWKNCAKSDHVLS